MLQPAQQTVSTEAAAQCTGRPTLQTGSLIAGALLLLQALPVYLMRPPFTSI